jgi:ubiquinone biosynthesis protein
MGKPLGEVSLGVVLGQIFQLATRFEIEVQPQYNLLQKTMMMAEGVARQLNPKADMWQLARPMAEAWMQREAGVKKRAEQLVDEMMQIIARVPKLFSAFEAAQPRPTAPPPPTWPGRVALVALLLAIACFFTNIH